MYATLVFKSHFSPKNWAEHVNYGSLIDQDRLANKTDQEPEISPTDRQNGSVGLVGLLNTLAAPRPTRRQMRGRMSDSSNGRTALYKSTL